MPAPETSRPILRAPAPEPLPVTDVHGATGDRFGQYNDPRRELVIFTAILDAYEADLVLFANQMANGGTAHAIIGWGEAATRAGCSNIGFFSVTKNKIENRMNRGDAEAQALAVRFNALRQRAVDLGRRPGMLPARLRLPGEPRPPGRDRRLAQNRDADIDEIVDRALEATTTRRFQSRTPNVPSLPRTSAPGEPATFALAPNPTAVIAALTESRRRIAYPGTPDGNIAAARRAIAGVDGVLAALERVPAPERRSVLEAALVIIAQELTKGAAT